MNRWARVAFLGGSLACAGTGIAAGQEYRLRLDTRFQRVAFRGVATDSIAAGDVVAGAGGGLVTPDGRAVTCIQATGFCLFYLPGPQLQSAPLVSMADMTVWGLGVPGLSVRGNARWGTDLSRDDLWPGTQPAVQLLEAYAEYATASLTGRLGRQHVTGRLGWTGIDGASVTLRPGGTKLDLTGYGGWGLARGVDVPITSPSLDPLEDFQLSRRHVTAGAAIGWRADAADLRAEYRREVDPSSDQFVSERAAMTAVVRPARRVSLTGSAEYDLAQGWWGTSDLTLRYDARRVSGEAGVQRYRPYFDLWTIWGAFSPVGHTSILGSVSVAPVPRLRLRASGERYWFDDDGAETGLATFEDRGWRISVAATATVTPALILDAGYHDETGPGAASRSWDARATWRPGPDLTLSVFGATLARPLELRFDQAQVDAVGLDAAYHVSERLQLALTGAQYFEDRRRPDPGAFDWDQFRVQARITWLFGSDADRLRLPPAIRGAGHRPGR